MFLNKKFLVISFILCSMCYVVADQLINTQESQAPVIVKKKKKKGGPSRSTLQERCCQSCADRVQVLAVHSQHDGHIQSIDMNILRSQFEGDATVFDSMSKDDLEKFLEKSQEFNNFLKELENKKREYTRYRQSITKKQS